VELRDALTGYAGWLGYARGERADAWVRRLDVNRPELEAFRGAATPRCAAYVASAATVAAPRGVSAAVSLEADAPAALERARAQAELNAFTWLPPRVDAKNAGFLAGVPVAVKDLMLVQGAPLSGGTRAMDRVVATRDAEVVARLRRAGAVVMGLANLHEFAYGITSDNPHFGRVVNPAAPSRIPGGSSGGSAAAVAAGITRVAVGTDTAGSIRIPAACCGIVGLKPSYDAIPRDGVLDLAYSLDHVGPMAASVADCAALFAAMLGLDRVPDWEWSDLGNCRVARLGGFFASPLDPEMRMAFDAAANALVADGARLAERSIDGIELAPAIQLNTIAPEATAYHLERIAERGHELGEDVRVRIEMGMFLPGPWYVKAQRLRTRLVAAIEAAFEDCDVLLCPTLRVPAPPVGASDLQIEGRPFALHPAITNLTLPFNLSGLPAVAVPWGRSKDGVPISMQIIARRGRDWDALAVARRLELARG